MSVEMISAIVTAAANHKTWVSLAREFGVGAEMLRYNLCRVHKLMVVKAILKGNSKGRA